MLKSIFETRAVFRLYDSIALKPIEPTQVKFNVPDYIQVIPKGEGFFVLIGKENVEEIEIESYIYQNMIVKDFKQEDIRYLWLMPRKTAKSTIVSIQGEANQTYYAFRESRMKLLKDKIKGSDEMEVYMDYSYRLEGREVVLNFENQYSLSRILDRIDNKFIVEDKESEYKKIRTTLSIAYKGTAQEDGKCEILVPDDEEYTVIDELGNVMS